MLVFIRMIPKSVTIGDLHRFVNKGMGSFWNHLFGRQGTITSILIFRVTNLKTHSVEYHGMVDIESAMSAQAAITRLNRTHLKVVPVEVRKFYQRSPLRDRRKSQSDMDNDSFKNLRKGDRRRNQLGIEPVYVSGSVRAGNANLVAA